MFNNTIDNKQHYINSDGVEMLDLSDSIFDSQESGITCTFYKVTSEMVMRPDLMSISAFGEDKYTEMIMKYSEIENPFAIDKDDLIAVPSLNSIYNEVKDTSLSNPETGAGGAGGAGSTGRAGYDLVKNYHKYIDKSKLPEYNGTREPEETGTKVVSQVEPNLANDGNSGISIINGRLYFGPNVSVNSSDIEDIDGDNAAVSNLVDCAKNGVTVGQFLNATVKNNLKSQ